MDKARRFLQAALAVCILIPLVVFAAKVLFGEIRSGSFWQSDQALINPLMGFAPMAQSSKGENTSLVYIGLTWRKIEPEPGVYDWEAFEEEYNIAHWREQNKRYVLRLVCDEPNEESHLDIPDWLYEATGDGDWYDISYGRGYAPNYANETFQQCHARLVQALADYFRQDGRVAFIELGSIGHWGEWHIKSESEIAPLPSVDVLYRYVRHWMDAFPDTPLLMRRPFSIAAEEGMGLFNDMAGHAHDTEVWLDWIESGGVYTQTGEEALSPMPNFWKTAPSGGEFTSSIPMEQLLGTDLPQTLELLRQSHTTFLGPKIADPELTAGYDAVNRQLGYRLWVREWSVSRHLLDCRLKMRWRNDGSAPFYANWPLLVEFSPADGSEPIRITTDAALNTILPGKERRVCVDVPKQAEELLENGGSIRIALIDPLTGEPGVFLAMDGWEHTAEPFLWMGD